MVKSKKKHLTMSGTYCYVWERDLLLVHYFNKLNNEIYNKFLKNKKDIYMN
jgi:hypothetical protein